MKDFILFVVPVVAGVSLSICIITCIMNDIEIENTLRETRKFLKDK